MSQHDNEHDERTQSRRHFLKMAAGTAAVAAVAGSTVFARSAQAAQLKPLSQQNSPLAKSLDYTDDASTNKNPKRKPGDDCANCMFYQGKPGSKRGPCQIFPGFSVDARGWCASHARKPA